MIPPVNISILDYINLMDLLPSALPWFSRLGLRGTSWIVQEDMSVSFDDFKSESTSYMALSEK